MKLLALGWFMFRCLRLTRRHSAVSPWFRKSIWLLILIQWGLALVQALIFFSFFLFFLNHTMRCCLRPGVAFHRLPGRLPLPVRCSATVKSPPTRQQRTYIREFHCTREDGTPELTSGFWEPRNEMWGWYTAWDEICDRDRDRAAATKDIHPCLTASHWHNVAWNTAQPALFAGGSAQTAKSPPYFYPNIMKLQYLQYRRAPWVQSWSVMARLQVTIKL